MLNFVYSQDLGADVLIALFAQAQNNLAKIGVPRSALPYPGYATAAIEHRMPQGYIVTMELQPGSRDISSNPYGRPIVTSIKKIN